MLWAANTTSPSRSIDIDKTKRNQVTQERPIYRLCNSDSCVQGFVPIPAGGHCGRLNDVRMAALTSCI